MCHVPAKFIVGFLKLGNINILTSRVIVIVIVMLTSGQISPERDVLINIVASHVAFCSHIRKLGPAKAEHFFKGGNWIKANTKHLFGGGWTFLNKD